MARMRGSSAAVSIATAPPSENPKTPTEVAPRDSRKSTMRLRSSRSRNPSVVARPSLAPK